MKDGTPTVCVPNPAGGCTRPYHDIADVNGGGPHGEANAVADVDGGKMDGFIAQRDQAKSSCTNPDDPACNSGGQPDVMGYHTGAEIPNYWTYAQDFVLDDHIFDAGQVVVAARSPVPGSLCKTPVITSLRTITWHVKKGGDTPHQVMGNGFSSR